MRNYKGAFYRTDETSREPSQCPDWLDLLATQFEIDESMSKTAASKSAVEVARERQRSQPSIYEMMSAIVSGQKPKFSSVEEAVKDYQRRTGLETYLKNAEDSNLSSLASEIVIASDEESEDEDVGDSGISTLESMQNLLKSQKPSGDPLEGLHGEQLIQEPAAVATKPSKQPTTNQGLKMPPPSNNWWDKLSVDDADDSDVLDPFRRNLDYGEARDMTEEELEANPGKKKLITQADDETEKPELLRKNPAIERFLTNAIETNCGIQLPAILHSLVETFGRDGVDYGVLTDHDLLQWINKRLINKNISHDDMSAQLGKGVGTHVDYTGERDSNKDPWTLLVPDKSSH